MQKILTSIPDGWGKKLEFGGGAIALACIEPQSFRMVANVHYFLIFFTAQPDRKLALNSDSVIRGFAPVGSLEIFPAQSDLFASWPVYKEALLVGMTNERLKSLARSENEQEDFELNTLGLGSIDRKALMLSQQIRNEMAYAEVGYDECVDALLTIFGVHILRNYSSIGKRAEKIYGGGLSPKNWSRLNDYIMANLSEKLTLEIMAEVVRLSPSHFSRAFKETVGQSPHRYVLSMRLATARKLLLTVDEPLEQIAKLAGFADNSHMAAAMRRFWGITPSMVKKELRR